MKSGIITVLTPIPQAIKSCLSQLNTLSFNRPPYGRFILGLASLMTGFAEAICLPTTEYLINQLTYYPTKERRQIMRTQSSAIKLVELAIKNGELVRPDRCEVCTSKPVDFKQHAIVGHHWNGYDDPLNLWWVCRSCNRFLAHKHDGSLNLEQAKIYVRKLQRAKLWHYSIIEVEL